MSSQSSLEEILSSITDPNNASVKQATHNIKAALKDPNIVSLLCDILVSSKSSQIRQYAAVLLQHKIQKEKVWKSLSADTCHGIKEKVLKSLCHESDKSTRKSIAQLFGSIAKHDLSNNTWPDLFSFLKSHVHDSDPQLEESAVYLLTSLCDSFDEHMKPYITDVMQVLVSVLDKGQNKMACFHTIQAISRLIYMSFNENTDLFQSVMPKILKVIQTFVESDQELVFEALGIFDDILDSCSTIIDTHLKDFVNFSLSIAANETLDNMVRVKALSFLSALFAEKKKIMLKHDVVEDVLQVIFEIICSGSDEEDNLEMENNVETFTPPTHSTQVVDVMALQIPSDKFIPLLMKILQPAFISPDVKERRAAFLTIAVSTEGCSDYIMDNYMDVIMDLVMKGVEDPECTVRNAALFALGQFSENLQPKVSMYATEILNLLYKKLENASQEIEKNSSDISKVYYALQMFCKSLGSDILPHLPVLMEHLLVSLIMNTTPDIKELIISVISATANAAKSEMKIYFSQIISELEKYLCEEVSEDALRLKIASMDTLSVFARTVGDDTFMPYGNKCIELALSSLKSSQNPDLKCSVYGLISAISHIPGIDMSQCLPSVISYMKESIQTTEGVQKHYSESGNPINVILNIVADDDNEHGQDDKELLFGVGEDDGFHGISVENAYLDEKEEACTALGELALNTKNAFVPYVEDCFYQVTKILGYPTTDLKCSALTALTSFCCVLHDYNESNKENESEKVLGSMVGMVFPRLIDIIKIDPDHEAVITAIDNLGRLISTLKTDILQDGAATDLVISCLRGIFEHELPCQEDDNILEDDADGNDGEAELDLLLIESACNILPAVAKVVDASMFQPIFTATFLPQLLKKLKESSSIPERLFCCGAIAEVVGAFGLMAAPLIDVIYPVFKQTMLDENYTVRSSSILGLGIIMSNNSPQFTMHYTDILNTLFTMVDKNDVNTSICDNICVMACRFIQVDKNALPIKKALAVVVDFLPLQELVEENNIVYTCLCDLFSTDSSLLMEHLPKIFHALSSALSSKEFDTVLQEKVVEFIQNVHVNHPPVFKNTLSSIPEESASKIYQLISSAV